MKKLQAAMIGTICLFSTNGAYAQVDELKKTYEGFKKEARANYEDFRKKANTQYAEFVRKAWKQYQTLPALPKPMDETVPPVVLADDGKGKPIESVPIPIDDVVMPPVPEPQPVPITPIREQPSADKDVKFAYCGTECSVRFGNESNFKLEGCGNEMLAKAWRVLSAEPYNNMVHDCLKLRKDLQLCDWAYLNMLMAFAEECTGKGNEATLLAAYIY